MACFVDSNYKFCGCCDVTTATLAWGIVLVVLGAIRLAAANILASFPAIWSIIFGVFCILAYCKPKSLARRNCLVIMFWIEIVSLIISIAMNVVVIIMIDDILDCGGFDDTCDSARLILIISLCVNVAIVGFIDLCIGSVLHAGRQQVKEEEEKGDDAKPSQTAQPGQPVT